MAVKGARTSAGLMNWLVSEERDGVVFVVYNYSLRGVVLDIVTPGRHDDGLLRLGRPCVGNSTSSAKQTSPERRGKDKGVMVVLPRPPTLPPTALVPLCWPGQLM